MFVMYSCSYVTGGWKRPALCRTQYICSYVFIWPSKNFPECRSFGMTLTNETCIRDEISNDLPGGMVVANQCCRERRPFALSRPSVCRPARTSFHLPGISAVPPPLPTGRISMKFGIEDFHMPRNWNIWLKSKILLRFTAAGYINSP